MTWTMSAVIRLSFAGYYSFKLFVCVLYVHYVETNMM